MLGKYMSNDKPYFYVSTEILIPSFTDGSFVTALKIEETHEIKDSHFNPNKIGYDEFESFYFCESEYDLFKLIVTFMKHKNLIGFLEGETELDDMTKFYIGKFLSSYDDYPELLI